jgi:hypothetical protein
MALFVIAISLAIADTRGLFTLVPFWIVMMALTAFATHMCGEDDRQLLETLIKQYQDGTGKEDYERDARNRARSRQMEREEIRQGIREPDGLNEIGRWFERDPSAAQDIAVLDRISGHTTNIHEDIFAFEGSDNDLLKAWEKKKKADEAWRTAMSGFNEPKPVKKRVTQN